MNAVAIVSIADLYYGNSAATVRMNNYAKALALAGVDVFLFSTQMNVFSEDVIEIEPGIHICKKTNKTINWYNIIDLFKFVISVKKILKNTSSTYSVLNYSASTSILLDVLLLLFFKKQHVFCEVNEVRKYASESKNRLSDSIYCYILEKTYSKYCGLIFISRTIQEYYSHKAKRSIVIPILSECNGSVSPKHYNSNKLDIVFIGTVSFVKENLEELLKGFLLFSKSDKIARLLLYGYASPNNKERLNNFIVKNSMSDKIVFMGPIIHKEVKNTMSKADVLVIPRNNNKQNYYGFSTKLSEYATSGVPIIMTDTGVIRDYFQDGVNCIICEGYDGEAFCKSFEKVVKMDIQERHNMAKNAFIVAQTKFDYKLYADKLKSFLLE